MHVLGTIASSKPTAVANSFESIATISLSGLSTATFSSIPTTYKHLQIRGIGRSNGTTGSVVGLRFNSDTANNYQKTYINSSGSSLVAGAPSAASYADIGVTATSITGASTFGVFLADIYNYRSTSQFKHLFANTGIEPNSTSGGTYQYSNYWSSTSAITSITVIIDANAFDTNSTIALYGIKG